MKIVRTITLLSATACLLATQAPTASAVNVWDAGANTGNWDDAQNWDDDVVAVRALINGETRRVLFPSAGLVNEIRTIDLGGVARQFNWFGLEGGYVLNNGTAKVAGGGPNAEFRSTGNNTINVPINTFGGGNDIKLLSTGGLLTLTGGTGTGEFDATKGLKIIGNGGGDFSLSGDYRLGFNSPGGGSPFEMSASGTATFEAGSQLFFDPNVGNGGPSNGTVSNGVLVFNGFADLDGALFNGVVSWTVDGGTLAGIGTITNNIFVNATDAGDPGTFAPGTSIGTFTAMKDVSFGAGAVFAVELDSGGVSDLLDVGGNLTLDPASILDVSSLGLAIGEYTIATYAGTLSGTFGSVTGLPGVTVDYGTGANSAITLTVIPEPATALLAVAGGACVLSRRRTA